mmetsp:Transcript_88069/g.247580  ORF Transcript_88069/g.247580 Transcript_88069/m.247580 type:complete len:343 (+) Transcript_88069:987-2015(+)
MRVLPRQRGSDDPRLRDGTEHASANSGTCGAELLDAPAHECQATGWRHVLGIREDHCRTGLPLQRLQVLSEGPLEQAQLHEELQRGVRGQWNCLALAKIEQLAHQSVAFAHPRHRVGQSWGLQNGGPQRLGAVPRSVGRNPHQRIARGVGSWKRPMRDLGSDPALWLLQSFDLPSLLEGQRPQVPGGTPPFQADALAPRRTNGLLVRPPCAVCGRKGRGEKECREDNDGGAPPPPMASVLRVVVHVGTIAAAGRTINPLRGMRERPPRGADCRVTNERHGTNQHDGEMHVAQADRHVLVGAELSEAPELHHKAGKHCCEEQVLLGLIYVGPTLSNGMSNTDI